MKCKLKGRDFTIHKLEFKVVSMVSDLEKNTVNMRILKKIINKVVQEGQERVCKARTESQNTWFLLVLVL